MLFSLLVLSACTTDSNKSSGAKNFSEDFLWGTATAGFQVDMGCPSWTEIKCTDSASDWYQWVTTPEIIDEYNLYVSGEAISNGPGMWELFESDIDQMAADGMSAYRMSIEWSRIFPNANAELANTVADLEQFANAEAVERYHAFFVAMKQANITPLVTINHYTLPLWVHNGVDCHFDPDGCVADGWVNEERITRLIALYSGYLASEFGRYVDRWVTLNEPFATTLSGYGFPGEDRSSPPGLSLDIPRVSLVMLNQIIGHAKMFHAVKEYDLIDADGDGSTAEVGIVMNMTAIEPQDETREDDVNAAANMDYLYHRLYLDAMTSGAWDGDLDGTPEDTRSEIANTLDFIGINYYNLVKVSGFSLSPFEAIPLLTFYPEFSWAPYPEGIVEVIQSASSYGLPIYITENGTPFVEDRGSEVLEGHLQGIEEALAQDIDVRGYFYWSYVDNYEWNHGFDLRFGLYELEPNTKERIPRPVRDTFSDIISRGRVVE